jgi:hypothetical protein
MPEPKSTWVDTENYAESFRNDEVDGRLVGIGPNPNPFAVNSFDAEIWRLAEKV